MPNSSTPLVHKDVDEAPKIPLIPSAIAAPLEGALSAVGGLASNGMAQVAERGQGLANGARPWMEFFDLSQFGLTGGGMNGYFERYRANFRYFFLNYFMVRSARARFRYARQPLTTRADRDGTHCNERGDETDSAHRPCLSLLGIFPAVWRRNNRSDGRSFSRHGARCA